MPFIEENDKVLLNLKFHIKSKSNNNKPGVLSFHRIKNKNIYKLIKAIDVGKINNNFKIEISKDYNCLI